MIQESDDERERKVRLPALCEIPEAKESMIMTDNRDMRRSYEKSTGRSNKDEFRPTNLRTLKQESKDKQQFSSLPHIGKAEIENEPPKRRRLGALNESREDYTTPHTS